MYDDFSISFSQKRKNPWKPFKKFMQDLESIQEFQNNTHRGIWGDFGAGNGRHLQIITQYAQKYIGTDVSFPLLLIARDQNDPNKLHHWVACDINALPFRKESFQSIVSVAVLHHILFRYQLAITLKRINRLLGKDGIAILAVWGAFKGKNESTIKRFNFHRRISKLPIIQPILGEHFALGVNDIVIPWTVTERHKESIKKPRIYHLFSFNEVYFFTRFLNLVKLQAVNMGNNAGMNYFLCLTKRNSNLMT